MLKGAPYGSLGLSAPSEWMSSDLISQTLLHFIGHMHVSKSNPRLLVLDNHRSHLGLEIITLAEKHSLAILTFPPHCSHRLQSLEVSGGSYGGAAELQHPQEFEKKIKNTK